MRAYAGILSYDHCDGTRLPRANECGFGHIAFAVENVDEALQAVIAAGGGAVGEIATAEVKGAACFVWFMREIPKVTLSSCRSGVEPEIRMVAGQANCHCLLAHSVRAGT